MDFFVKKNFSFFRGPKQLRFPLYQHHQCTRMPQRVFEVSSVYQCIKCWRFTLLSLLSWFSWFCSSLGQAVGQLFLKLLLLSGRQPPQCLTHLHHTHTHTYTTHIHTHTHKESTLLAGQKDSSNMLMCNGQNKNIRRESDW